MTTMPRVLIVDDDESILYYLRTLFEASGYDVESAVDGAEALAKARHSPPRLVISDLLMPVMDGYALLRRWKLDEKLKDIPFVVYTATYTAPEDEDLATNLGADAFIVKPMEPAQLMKRIHEVRSNAAGVRSVHMPSADVRTSSSNTVRRWCGNWRKRPSRSKSRTALSSRK